MKKSMLFVLIALLGLPMAAMAAISGDCANCHTMHNSEQGAPVAKRGFGATTASATPIENLLRFDCIACHAQNAATNVVAGIPQVYHTGDDLAAGNFRYIDTLSSDRKGHNVKDLFTAGDSTFSVPPGFDFGPDAHKTAFGAAVGNFTCAGAAGCHGTRSQMFDTTTKRTGMAAISGAHHQSQEDLRNPGDQVATLDGFVHDGSVVAAGYRFIPGLKGEGNATNPWQNVDEASHNEYYGDATPLANLSDNCQQCHAQHGSGNDAKMNTGSTLFVPNNSMSGFCSTCHGDFHSAGGLDGENGSSGAFLRHPSDYVLPAGDTEYAAYTSYKVSAPVARPDLTAAFDSATVRPGTDMVMCLSCHKAHASEYDGMLRFDYEATTMQAGGSILVADRQGCLACHTTK